MVKCQEDSLIDPHPYCLHGPTLLFYPRDKPEKGYYACALYRDKNKCNYHLAVTDATTENLNFKNVLPTDVYIERRLKFMNPKFFNEQRHYCLKCNFPVLESKMPKHVGHEMIRNITVKLLQDPTRFLPPIENDKIFAQYFFDDKSLKFFAKCIHHLRINKVICMGAPRLHAYLRHKCKMVKSMLLDIDHRFFYFYDNKQFTWYNMCNNHFYDKKQKEYFHTFLQCGKQDRLLIFTDPPFGCRTEPIAHTLRQITKLHNTINMLPHQPLPIFWIFPYFSEHYIQEQMPEMEMCDYKVNYTNHTSYTDIGDKRRKLGSPVRVFTNVPLGRLLLPVEEEYKYCTPCQRYTALENRHCSKCATCPSKNGATYRHCNLCGICVKPNYVHCDLCRRCTQVEGHDCVEYQANQRCWICLQVGHTERECVAWQEYCEQKNLPKRNNVNNQEIICLLCGRLGHNELRCKQRHKYIEETQFLNDKQLKFKF